MVFTDFNFYFITFPRQVFVNIFDKELLEVRIASPSACYLIRPSTFACKWSFHSERLLLPSSQQLLNTSLDLSYSLRAVARQSEIRCPVGDDNQLLSCWGAQRYSVL